MTADLLEEWEVYGRAAGWSESTITVRRRVLLYLGRTAAEGTLEELTALQLARLLAGYPSRASAGTYWRHAHSFFSWLKLAGYRADDPTEVVKMPRPRVGTPRPVSDQALTDVLAGNLAPRTRAYVLLAAYAGLRVHEIAKIRGEDIDPARATLRVVGKGGIEAVLPLHPKLAELVEHYPRAGYWFPTRAACGHMTPEGVSATIKRAFANAGHHITAHQLRHWFGTNVLRSSGGNLRVAQELLRHASPATTAIYTRLDDADRTSAVLALT